MNANRFIEMIDNLSHQMNNVHFSDAEAERLKIAAQKLIEKIENRRRLVTMTATMTVWDEVTKISLEDFEAIHTRQIENALPTIRRLVKEQGGYEELDDDDWYEPEIVIYSSNQLEVIGKIVEGILTCIRLGERDVTYIGKLTYDYAPLYAGIPDDKFHQFKLEVW